MMSMAAFAIGIGNLWKFPYVVGNSGGGAFLLVYVIMVLIFGIPCFMIELALGRASQQSPISGMRVLEGNKKNPWQSIGWLGAIAIFLICSYAITIVGGWGGGYIPKVIGGTFEGMDADQIGGVFGAYAGSTVSIIGNLIAALLLLACLLSGVKRGVERICSILLPTLFVIMIGLAIYANTLPGASEGLIWYLKPDFSAINLSVISAAGMQVCFSIGIGMCCAFVYGSYLEKESSLFGSAVTTGLLDTLIAILAGLLIVPALFSFGIEPTAGPSLIFVTLPQLFTAMGSFGRIFGGLFMLCVFFAGFTSILGGAESLVATLTDSTKLTRKTSAIVIVCAMFLLSIPVTYSFAGGSIGSLTIMGFGLFDFMDFISSGICLPIGAVLMLAYVIFRWKYARLQDEVAGANGKGLSLPNGLKYYFYIVLPIILLFIVYSILRSYLG